MNSGQILMTSVAVAEKLVLYEVRKCICRQACELNAAVLL